MSYNKDINDNIPHWKEIGLPESFINLSKMHKGLILALVQLVLGNQHLSFIYKIYIG